MIEEMRKASCQSRFVNCRTSPTTSGPAMPPKLPIMFVLPETVPAYLPPTSMQVVPRHVAVALDVFVVSREQFRLGGVEDLVPARVVAERREENDRPRHSQQD